MKSLRELAEELLDLYADAKRGEISETSGTPDIDYIELDREVAEYRKLIEDAAAHDLSTDG